MIVIGLDPGLTTTGWGILEKKEDGAIRVVSYGKISPAKKQATSMRLDHLFRGLSEIIKQYGPQMAAIEQTFVNQNPASALLLGQARGVVMMVPAHFGLMVCEYAATTIKKTVTGQGHASKEHTQRMVKHLLSMDFVIEENSADALSVALCHIYHIL